MLGLAILVGIVAVMLLGYLAFPLFSRLVGHQDCVAAGYTNCDASQPRGS